MPIAVRTVIEGQPGQDTTLLPSDRSYPHWRILIPEVSSSLRFGAAIAPLIEGATVAGYAAYRGVLVAEDYYDNGLAMIVPNVDLGNDGFLLSIDLLGSLSGGTVLRYDAYNFTSSSASSVGFEVDYLWTVDDRAHFKVSGVLQAGQFALLLRDNEDGPSQTFSQEDEAPTITVPSTGSLGTVQLNGDKQSDLASVHSGDPSAVGKAEAIYVTDDTPQEPGDPDPWTCQAQSPNPDDCPQPAVLLSEDRSIVTLRSPTVYKADGGTFEIVQARTQRFVVNLMLTGSGGSPLYSGGGFEVGYESELVTTESWTAGAGEHGLGECIKWFRKYLTCAQVYKVKIDGVDVSPDRGSGRQEFVHDYDMTANCKDLIISETVCARKP